MGGGSRHLSESEDVQDGEAAVFSPPAEYKRVKHLKKFHKKKGSEQLWLIKLPHDLDVTKIKSLPLAVDGQEQLIPVEGAIQYSIGEDQTQKGGSDSANLSLLVPEEGRESLKISGRGRSLEFDKVFNVSETVRIPEIDYKKLAVPRSNVVKVEGLQARHFASGYGPEVEEEQEHRGEHKSKKHKRHSDSDSHARKSKKEKKK